MKKASTNRYLLVLSLLLLATSTAVHGAGPAALPADAARIESMDVVKTTTGVELTINTSRPVRWTAFSNTALDLILRIPDSLPGSALHDLQLSDGLVASVRALPTEAADSSTDIEVQTRQESAFAVSPQGNRLMVTFSPAPNTGGAAGGPVTAERVPERPSSYSVVDTLLGPGDVLQIDVFGLDDFDRKVRVLRDGTISLPLIGNIEIADRSVQQAEKLISTLLAERQLVNDPQVSIFVEEFVSHTVSVQGAVESPGVYPLKGRSTLLDLISAAGGLSEKRGSTILVVRSRADGSNQSIDVDAEALVARGDLSLNLPLQPGDIVMVPQAREFRVYVTGAVRNPGPVDYLSSDGITVLQAVTAAGGPTERANLRNVHILRKLPDGTQERIRVSIKRIRAGKKDDVVLEKNDTVVVGEWFL